MFEFFDTILGYIQMVWDFFVGLIEGLITAIGVLVASSNFSVVLIGYVPAIIGASVSIVIALCVVKFLIGR